MTDESANLSVPGAGATRAPGLPAAVDRATFQAELDLLRAREKAHTREGDAISAARRRLPMVEIDASLTLIGPHGPLTLLGTFEGRQQLIAYYFMWNPGRPAEDARHTLLAGRQIGLFHLVCYLRDGDRVFETYWTSRRGAEALDYSYALMDLTLYGRQEPWEDSPAGWPQQCTYTRTSGGSPDWPPAPAWPGGRPIAQWPRIEAGRSDDLTIGP